MWGEGGGVRAVARVSCAGGRGEVAGPWPGCHVQGGGGRCATGESTSQGVMCRGEGGGVPRVRALARVSCAGGRCVHVIPMR